jgi:hypothetical protein
MKDYSYCETHAGRDYIILFNWKKKRREAG